ncbi:MAG TPA: cytochrome c oxidase assembly protein [Candidatus Binataceae bacterium]|jgi:putative membrane protein
MWTAEPQVVLAIALVALVYVGASIGMKRRPNQRQQMAFWFGIVMLFAALTGPLGSYAKGFSFSAYIFQQMLLVFVVPPLFLLGLPDWMARPVMMHRFVEPWMRRLTRPLIAFLTFSMFFALLHYPALCDEVCHARPFYGSIRVALVLVGLLLWWPMLSPLPEYPRLTYPMQILYLFLLMIPMTAVAAPITMAETVLYTFYSMGEHPFGLSALDDQVLGGLIMWIGQGVYIMFIFSGIFFRWAQREDSEVPAINRKPARVHVLRPHDRPAL